MSLPPLMIVPLDPIVAVTCQVYARLDLNPNAPAGGQWTYNGYSTSSSGPFNMTPAVPIFPGLVADDVIMQGDDFPIMYKGKTPGFYQMTYDYPGGSDVITLQIMSNSICTGTEGSDTVPITDNTPIDLLTYLASVDCPSPDVTGTWTDLDGAGAAFSAGFLTPSLLPAVGDYSFRYNLQENLFSLVTCSSCLDFEGTVTITAINAFTVTISSVNTTCNYTLEVIHPGTLVSNDIEVVMDAGVSRDFPVAKFKTKVTNDCGFATVTSATQTYSPSHVMYTGSKMGGVDPELVAGGFIETVRFYSVDTGNIEVPCAPSGINQAIFSGSAGTTNATDLTFPVSLSSTVFSAAINIAIKNYLIDALGLVSETDFSYKFASVGASPRWITIYAGVYDSPPTSWAGLQRGNVNIAYRADGVSLTNSTTFSTLISTFSMYGEYTASPCLTGIAKLTYTSVPQVVNSFVDVANVDYDAVPMLSNTLTVSATGGSNLTEACSSKNLTANPLNCMGVTTYSWSPSGEVTQSITALVGSGTHTVTASCTAPASVDSEDITI